ncbi:hypothetical protein KSB_30020 [Ktedonobacter robiniae]|uniref:Uncharacterized protein n=1 Tax=Ktedonobacter robiniae TaxID=2778365 RepID=A0ABQ3UPJ8_9CHLR|nr:hypothetical protein KSB_30020 [Ktedonobacter robiniae]
MKEKAFVALECQWTGNALYRIRHLQQEQIIYGPYALIPDTVQTYEEAIQSLVAENLRQQYETRRERRKLNTER